MNFNKLTHLTLISVSSSLLYADDWVTNSQEEWTANKAEAVDIDLKEGFATPSKESATFKSVLKSYPEKRSATSITISQSPIWLNWNPIKHLGPTNLEDAPVALRLGEGNYWLFGKYGGVETKGKGKKATLEGIVPGEDVELEGFEIALKESKFPNQYHAEGGLKQPQGGYHAWQSKDMINWVHHGPVSDVESRWMTTAEYVDGKAYLYYDFPNDQDPHLIIDDNLTDGELGEKMGMAFKDPSDGSDTAIIRDLEGQFHIIFEDWSVINASKRSWDSPLAGHAVSPDGIKDFKIVDPAVDYRTNPTGKFGKIYHPHWHVMDPENYPAEVIIKKDGTKVKGRRAIAKYEIHEPEQEAYGDWAAISIGGQYYLFGDYDPVGTHGPEYMKTVWFTASDIDEPFKKCGTIGTGHPDPDIIFAEGQFYMISQTDDFVSPGPWVDGVEIRVGVDVDNDKKVDNWTDWASVKEEYSGTEGFAKQVTKTPASLDLSTLPEGFGFQYEVRLSDKTENDSKPILDKVVLSFKE